LFEGPRIPSWRRHRYALRQPAARRIPRPGRESAVRWRAWVGVRQAGVFRIRNAKRDKDIVIAHVRRVFVRPGERVERGQRIARASDAAAPDGCHLHFEVRPARADYTSAVDPERLLRARRTD